MIKISDNCRGCGVCIPACPADAIKMKTGAAEIDNNRCMECGICIISCPFNYISQIYS